MRKSITLCMFLFVSVFCVSPAFAQEEAGDAQSIIAVDPETDQKIDIWKSDSKTIFSMIAELCSITTSEKDSTLQKEKKKKQYAQLHDQMNKKYKGKNLSLKAVCVQDVKPEKDITPYGKKKAKELIAQMKSDPSVSFFFGNGDPFENPFFVMAIAMYLGSDPQCFKETGRYVITYNIPIPEDNDYSSYSEGIFVEENKKISVIIKYIEKSEEKASSFSKRQIMPLSGKIRSIAYSNSVFSEKIEITIE